MKVTLLASTLLFLFINATAQVPGEKMTPAPVKAKFKEQYPDAKLLRWEIKGLVKEYVAVFNQGDYHRRARYSATGVPLLLYTFHKAAIVPANISAQVLAAHPGFKVDWANEWKNFLTGGHFFELRLSKPGYVLKAWVKPDGNIMEGNQKEMNPDGDPVQEGN